MSVILSARFGRTGAVRACLRLCVVRKSRLAPKKQPSTYAMEYFDSFYGKAFGLDAWRQVRIALLSKKKYCAVVNPFSMTEDLIEKMRSLGCREVIGQHSGIEASKTLPTVQMTELPPPMPDILQKKKNLAVFEDSYRLIEKGKTEPLSSFVPATEMIYQEAVVNDEKYFNFLKPEKGSEIALKTYQPLPLLPLLIYTFPTGVIKDFPVPRKPISGLFEYYLMDAASLLPVMALDIKPGDDFADFCAAPGGKTLAVAFMQRARTHFCSDISPSRVQRLKGIIKNYVPRESRKNIIIKQKDMTLISDDLTYDKILVDVPCSNDRHSLGEEENNLYHPIRNSERLAIPEKQKAILTHALCRLRVGGVTVYSTCSLSPVQNDSVVHMTLQSFKRMKFVVTDLTETFKPFADQKLYQFYNKCRYGQLVMPSLPNNYGPMYVCRIERVK
ncbi:putative methyltransferase NSUN4-like [Tropilaelaps mercedesae]|uniref:NOL1/NOP2/Sun domain family member 4 n=1 Tax=Tropilaelaps mercedesae TaxID=418985 RepID=A0A1V9XJZ2_9ACAR|nr:putative methyltransferase NSUN4-like [Tropilaelaps mercedesae]